MMKRLFLFTTLLTVLVFLIPVFTVLRNPALRPTDVPTRQPTDTPTLFVPPAPTTAAVPSTLTPTTTTSNDNTQLNVKLSDGTVTAMPMSDYIFSVLAGEMEPTAPEEALKAQAVAIRTFAARNVAQNQASPQSVHSGTDADVCADHTHCMAFRARDAALADWQTYTDAQANAAKLDGVIAATDGQVLTYNNEPILAVFHAISGGQTESAQDAWGGGYPYLVNVDSAVDEQATGFITDVVFTAEAFKALIQTQWPDADLTAAPDLWIADITRSAAGGILTCTIGGVNVTGAQLRNVCGLRSTNIAVTVANNTLTLKTRGYGHGVGMSQAGAIGMANNGSGYADILAHYYPGAVLG